MPVDGVAAAQTLLSYGGIRGGYCLFYVWQAYKAHGASTGRSAPTATEAWYRSDGRHPADRNPPPGVPVFWGPKASSNAGDVVISLGGGLVAATDWPRYGVTGVCSIDERERQIGRPYLGWAECIFDQPVGLPAPAGQVIEEEQMNGTQEGILKAAAQGIIDLSTNLKAISDELLNGREEYYGGKYTPLQILLSHSTQTLGLSGAILQHVSDDNAVTVTLSDEQAADLAHATTLGLAGLLQSNQDALVAQIKAQLPPAVIDELRAALA